MIAYRIEVNANIINASMTQHSPPMSHIGKKEILPRLAQCDNTAAITAGNTTMGETRKRETLF